MFETTKEAFMPDKTIAVAKKIVSDIKRIAKISDYILQVAFIGFYLYSIFTNLDKITLLIINVILLLIAIFYLIYTIAKQVGYVTNRKTQKKVSKSYRRSKLFIRIFTIGFAIYEIVQYNPSKLKIILTIITGVMFLLQILIEVVREVLENYFGLLGVAIKEDYDELLSHKVVKGLMSTGKTVGNVTNAILHPKETIVAIADKTLDLLDKDKKDEDVRSEEISAKEQKQIAYVNELAEKEKTATELKKNSQKEARKAQFKENVSNLKDKANKVFKRNK